MNAAVNVSVILSTLHNPQYIQQYYQYSNSLGLEFASLAQTAYCSQEQLDYKQYEYIYDDQYNL